MNLIMKADTNNTTKQEDLNCIYEIVKSHGDGDFPEL